MGKLFSFIVIEQIIVLKDTRNKQFYNTNMSKGHKALLRLLAFNEKIALMSTLKS